MYFRWTRWILTHWVRATHICVGKLFIIGSDNGLLPGRRQAIIWTNVAILLIGPLGTNFSEILIGIQTFSFTKMSFKVLSAKWRPFCLGLNVLHGCIRYERIREVRASKSYFWLIYKEPGPCLKIKTVFPRYGDSHVKDMGIPILVRRHLYIETTLVPIFPFIPLPLPISSFLPLLHPS